MPSGAQLQIIRLAQAMVNCDSIDRWVHIQSMSLLDILPGNSSYGKSWISHLSNGDFPQEGLRYQL